MRSVLTHLIAVVLATVAFSWHLEAQSCPAPPTYLHRQPRIRVSGARLGGMQRFRRLGVQ
jgi:hypothetical protein